MEIELSPNKIEMLKNSDATTLRQNIVDGKLTCQDAVAYFAQRSFKHGRRLCIVAQENYGKAMQLALTRDL